MTDHVFARSFSVLITIMVLALVERARSAVSNEFDVFAGLEIRADSPSNNPSLLNKQTDAVRLASYTVLGSRIRQTQDEGPSPVSVYDQEYIRNTDAMTLADFLNRIPQNYTGIASGRSSAPNELNPEFGQRDETSSPPFSFVLMASAAPPGQTGVSGVSLRGLGSGSTLVLVDGRRAVQSGQGNQSTTTRQGFVDLNTIPLGMIERIEISTDGASAIYGADAVAGVINIILKKGYTGTEIRGGIKVAEHGGGRERTLSVTSGFVQGKLSGSVTVDYYDRKSLRASERGFSEQQDHRDRVVGSFDDGSPVYGRDFRLNWGYPAVIQATSGVVFDEFDMLPGVRVVMVPKGSSFTPGVGGFIPVTSPVPEASNGVIDASGQRRTNTANYLDLIPESTRRGLSSNFNYQFHDRLDGFVLFRTSDTKSVFHGQVGANTITGSFGSAVTLQAAYNPFNQDVTVGMILPEWGSQMQRVRTIDEAMTLGLRGVIAENWKWELAGTWGRQKVRQVEREFDSANLVGLLNHPDPAQRFNPFIDYTAAGSPSQAALLETLSLYPTRLAISRATGLDFVTDGTLFNLPGGGTKMAIGTSIRRDKVASTAIASSSAMTSVDTEKTVFGSQMTKAMFVEFLVPFWGRENSRGGLQRLDLNLAVRYESNERFAKTVPKVGLSWAPAQTLLVRGSWSEGFRAPGVTEYFIAPTVRSQAIQDPRRNPSTTTGVQTTTGSHTDPQPELSENTFVGLVYEPNFAEGVNFQVNYYNTVQRDVLQQLSAQTIVNNETIFGDRITRDPAAASDMAKNQPGPITAVDSTFVSFGKVVNRSMDIVFDYRVPWEEWGRFRVNVAASRTLESSLQLAPDEPTANLDHTTSAPPRWRLNAEIFWSRSDWNASVFMTRIDGFTDNTAGNLIVANTPTITFSPTPAVTKVDLRCGYEFKNGVWRGYGKNLRLSLGVSNVFDKEPPFSGTLWGFNAGLHHQFILGRAYELSFSLPF